MLIPFPLLGNHIVNGIENVGVYDEGKQHDEEAVYCLDWILRYKVTVGYAREDADGVVESVGIANPKWLIDDVCIGVGRCEPVSILCIIGIVILSE